MTLLINGKGNVVDDLSAISADIVTLDGLHDVPDADSAGNSYIRDVIGNKTDTYAGDSLAGFKEKILNHIHSAAKCYPTLADGVVLTGAAGAWTLGAFQEIIPAAAITTYFDLHWIVVEAVSASDIYEIVLYSGSEGNEVEIARGRSLRNQTTQTPSPIPIQVPIQSPNARISGKVASKSGGGDTVTISLYYHQYS